jgi:nicotinamide-nucleotide amidase
VSAAPPVAEVLTIGDELLSGETVDTNASWLDARLEAWGWAVHRHVTVPDDVDAIAGALREAAARARLVIASGGLGPTDDDLTLEALARALDVPLVEHAETWARIEARFARLGRVLTPNNRRQARVPRGAEVFANEAGTAPCVRAELGAASVFVVPGVPREMRHLADAVIAPRVTQPGPRLARRTLRTIGLGESRLEHELRDVVAGWPEVRFGYRTLGLENHVKLATVRPELLDPVEAAVRGVHGAAIFGRDDETLERAVVERFTRAGRTLAAAESCTGGLVASRIVDVAGASRVFVGGVVAYADTVKTRLLGVDAATISREGAVSAAVAGAMAEGARRALGADHALATTGIAGPDGGTPTKPVGLVYVALAGPDGVRVEELRLSGDRAQIRAASAAAALGLAWRMAVDSGY